jgi:hypothetical protein
MVKAKKIKILIILEIWKQNLIQKIWNYTWIELKAGKKKRCDEKYLRD